MFFDPLKRRRRRQDLYLLRDLYFLRKSIIAPNANWPKTVNISKKSP